MVPYLVLKPEFAPQRKYPLREVLNALFWITRTGAQWEYRPTTSHRPRSCRSKLGVGLKRAASKTWRMICRVQQKRGAEPTAVIINSRTLQSTPESGHRAGYDGAKKRKGTKVHLVVDTLEHLLTVLTSPANEQDRAQVKQLCLEVQEVAGVKVEVAFADQG